MDFNSHLGLELLDAGADFMRARCAVDDHLRQPYGLVHGGVLASMAETLASVGTALGVAERGDIAVGQSNTTNFLRPILEGTIHAEGRPRHRGRTSWIWDVELTDDAGNVCAISRLVIAVRPQRAG